MMNDLKESENNEKFIKFVEKYWNYRLPQQKDQQTSLSLAPKDLTEIKRGQWYCNITGKLIPELQQFNTLPVVTPAKMIGYRGMVEDAMENNLDGEKDTTISGKLYMQGYNSFHVYKCGHCFLDIGELRSP